MKEKSENKGVPKDAANKAVPFMFPAEGVTVMAENEAEAKEKLKSIINEQSND